MRFKRGWQQKERLVASWFKTVRNPLSGRNNVDDSGGRRCGDVIMGYGLVEVKRKKALSMKDAKDTQQLARARNLPWAHMEFQTGTPSLVQITLDYENAKIICEALRTHWIARASVPPVRD